MTLDIRLHKVVVDGSLLGWKTDENGKKANKTSQVSPKLSTSSAAGMGSISGVINDRR